MDPSYDLPGDALCVDDALRLLRWVGLYRSSLITKLLGRIGSRGSGERTKLARIAATPDLALWLVGAQEAWLATRKAPTSVEEQELRGLGDAEGWPRTVPSVVGWPQPAWAIAATEAIGKGLTRRDDKPLAFASEPEIRKATERIDAALRLLSQAWPEEAAICRAVISDVVLVEHAGFYSSSIPATFGAVYLGSAAVPDALGALLLLVHETAHHALVVEEARGALLGNPSVLATSPLRARPRPLMAVLHATYVCSVLVGCLRRLPQAPGDRRIPAELERYSRGLEGGLRSLGEMAILTARGTRLLQLMRATERGDRHD